MQYKKLQHKELISWIRLIRTTNVGDITFYSLLKIYNSATAALEALPSIINKCKINKNVSVYSIADAEREFEKVTNIGGEFVPYCDPNYPSLLRHIRDAPPIITILGNRELLHSKNNIAVVGSRTPTLNSVRFAEKISQDLSEHGFVIVSGLAGGIDAAGHSVVFKYLPSIAIMATGIDICYPSKNQHLYDRISKDGLCISELPFGCCAKAQFFPRRNRIVSGISKGVLIVEAKSNSGSLITAKFALMHDREVFAVPGFPADERFSGNNYLLKEGAVLVEGVADIVHAFEFNFKSKLESDYSMFSDINSYKKFCNSIDETSIDMVKSIILKNLSFDPIDIEDLSSNIDEDAEVILMAIIELELSGVIYRTSYNAVAIKYRSDLSKQI